MKVIFYYDNIENLKHLRGKFSWAVLALIITLLAVVSATYAWYIYNTRRHTTKVQLAAGAGVNLQISNAYDGPYSSASVLDNFEGQLNPVSTNRHVYIWMEGTDADCVNGKAIENDTTTYDVTVKLAGVATSGQ